MDARLIVIAVVLVAFPKVFSHDLYPTLRPGIGSCLRLSESSDIFGNRTHFSDQGLLPSLFIRSESTDPLTLRIVRVHMLCEAIGLYRNTASSASYLVEYEVTDSEVPDSITMLKIAQVSVDCVPDSHNPFLKYSFYPKPQRNSIQSSDLNTARNSLGTLYTDISGITSNFSTETAFICGRCGLQGGIFADPATRCVCK